MKRMLLFFRVLAITCCLSACTSNGGFANRDDASDSSSSQSAFDDRHVDLIVTDLVAVMVQVSELAPLTTTLQLADPRGVFGNKLHEALEQAGYGIQRVSQDQGDNYLSYESRTIRSEASDVTDFSIRAGEIEVRREYNINKGKILPASMMYLSGTSKFAKISLNKDIFLQQGGQLKFASATEITLLDETVITDGVDFVSQSSGALASRKEGANIVQAARNLNFKENSDALLKRRDEFRSLRRAKFIFEEDSAVFGRENKAIIQKLLSDYDRNLDVLFISACAFSDETQEHVNEHVTRLKEELILSGVAAARVVEEGCATDEYPDGVVTSKHTIMVVQRQIVGDVGEAAIARSRASFPNRPLALTIPDVAGSATDFQARLITTMAGEEGVFGHSIMTVNKSGDGGRSGWAWFAETARDSGYEIATYSIPGLIAQSIKFSTQYNIDTLEPLVNWGADPAVLIVPLNSPFETLADFIRFAKANPGKLTVSGGGSYVGHHIALLQLQKAAGISLNYLPADNSETALAQVEDSTVLAGFNDMSDVVRQGNDIRVLAIADLQRNSAVPLVPTFVELGVIVDDSSINYRGLMVPMGTPIKVIELLSEAALRMVSHPSTVRRMEQVGVPLKIMERKEIISFWKTRQTLLTSLLKDL